jgi:hypothetical protein
VTVAPGSRHRLPGARLRALETDTDPVMATPLSADHGAPEIR